MSETLTITRPDDWHLHVRDGAAMASVVRHSAAQFGRALIMPNLKPPVTTAASSTSGSTSASTVAHSSRNSGSAARASQRLCHAAAA